MHATHLLDRLPLWAFFVCTILIVLGSIRGGLYLGLLRRKRSAGEPEGPVGCVVGAMLGLLAFMLAFTFGMAASRFDTRKKLLLDEVNAIGTAELRARLLPAPHGAACSALLTNYVNLRIEATRDPAKLSSAIAESEKLQDQLWAHAVSLSQDNLDSEIVALFAAALNEVFDLHTSRATVALQYRIPPHIWLALLVVAVFTMAAVGYQFGLSGRGSLLIHIALAITFSAVVLLIADLDRAWEGALRVSQQPMIELQSRLNGAEE